MESNAPQRRKKRVRPARKILPRGNLGIGWIVGSLLVAAVILAAGAAYLLAGSS